MALGLEPLEHNISRELEICEWKSIDIKPLRERFESKYISRDLSPSRVREIEFEVYERTSCPRDGSRDILADDYKYSFLNSRYWNS